MVGSFPICNLRTSISRVFDASPHRLHLFPCHLPHFLVIEDVFAFLVLGGPQHRLRRVGEVTAAQVRRRVRLFPGDVVQNLEPELLQGVSGRCVTPSEQKSAWMTNGCW
jgi:hypothetical protein